MEVDGEKEREECEEEKEEEEEEEEEEWEQVGPKNKSTITRQVFRRNDLNLPPLSLFDTVLCHMHMIRSHWYTAL